MTKTLTEQQARELAKQDRYYSARCRRGEWFVWCAIANHEVMFEHKEAAR